MDLRSNNAMQYNLGNRHLDHHVESAGDTGSLQMAPLDSTFRFRKEDGRIICLARNTMLESTTLFSSLIRPEMC